MPPVYLTDKADKCTHVVLTIEEFEQYEAAAGQSPVAPPVQPLLSADRLFITLPHGGAGARIDLHRFAYAWRHLDPGRVFLPIAKKTQKLSRFTGPAANGLDAILRRCCLPDDSPYRDTMQATKDVVDALVETEWFSRSVRRLEGFYRPVQCLEVHWQTLISSVGLMGPPSDPIPIEKWQAVTVSPFEGE